ncbi:MAG: S1 RNA-binding domain-containing protein [Candidatus Pacebacteria bacterium]|nr:S1 RNA-binding domain-containing protein [Candidatus Paceibacterota bacterium]
MVLKNLKKIKTDLVCPPKVGELVEGAIINRGKSALYVDLGAKGIGVIYGREFFDAKEGLKNHKVGDKLVAKVVGMENEEGYRELSLAEASQEMSWGRLNEARESGVSFEVQIRNANKGGLICPLMGINGFLPTSQLLPEHYPKVAGGDPSKIALELQKLVGQKMTVKIFDLDPRDGKLILSEKATKKDRAEEELKDYMVGDMVEGEISGVTGFGAFIKFGKDLEGLIHSSEISIEPDQTPDKVLSIGQKVQARIIEIANNRIYLSLKNEK